MISEEELGLLFENPNCTVREEIEFERLDSSKETALVKYLLGVCLKIVSLKLGETDAGQSSPDIQSSDPFQNKQVKQKNFLRFDNPFHEDDEVPSNSTTQRSLFSKLARAFWIAFAAYSALKLTLLAILQFKLDHLLEITQKQLKNRANSTWKGCVLVNDADRPQSSEDLWSRQRLQEVIGWVETIGSSIPLKGAGAVAYEIVAFMPVIFLFLGLMAVNKREFRVDRLSFIFNRFAERARFQSELNIIIGRLIKGLRIRLDDKLVEVCKEVNKSVAESRYKKHESTNAEPSRGKPSVDINKARANNDTAKIDKLKDASDLMNILFEIHLMGLVRPANMSIRAHRMLLRLDLGWLLLCFVNSLLTYPMIGVIVFLFELYTRTEHRMEQLECLKWQPTAVTIENAYYLQPLATKEYRDAYEAFDGSLGARIYLLLVEYMNARTPSRFLFGVELIVSFDLGCILIAFYCIVATHSCADRTVWLNQIDRQVEACNQIMSSLIDEQRGASDSTRRRFVERKPCQRNRLIRALTITYLNLELFRRQQSSFGKLINFSLVQLSLFIMVIFVLCYVAGTTLRTGNNELLLLMSTYAVMIFNIPLVINAHRISKMERIMRNLTVTLARSSQLDWLSQSQLMNLWRRQVLTDREVISLFASSLLGVPVTYQRVLSFNAYLAALWLILLKVSL